MRNKKLVTMLVVGVANCFAPNHQEWHYNISVSGVAGNYETTFPNLESMTQRLVTLMNGLPSRAEPNRNANRSQIIPNYACSGLYMNMIPCQPSLSEIYQKYGLR